MQPEKTIFGIQTGLWAIVKRENRGGQEGVSVRLRNSGEMAPILSMAQCYYEILPAFGSDKEKLAGNIMVFNLYVDRRQSPSFPVDGERRAPGGNNGCHFGVDDVRDDFFPLKAGERFEVTSLRLLAILKEPKRFVFITPGRSCIREVTFVTPRLKGPAPALGG